MLPISLRFKGLHSYKQAVSIDFRTLVDAQLFGIFGATGSGKSTILEAITLALFGESERLGSTNLSSMVNLSATEMWIEFEFCQQGADYLFELKYTRAKGDLDRAATVYHHKAAKKVNGQWLPLSDKGREVKTLATDILGITADNFRRTTIIPQGKFQEFLTLKGAERGSMMENLFKLERFNLSDKVKALRDKTDQEYQFVIGQLASIGEADATVIKGLEQDLSTQKQQLATQQAALHDRGTTLAQQDNLEQVDRRHKQTLLQFERLTAEQASREAAFQEARRYARAEQALRPILDDLQRTTLHQHKLSQDRVNFEAELNRLVLEIQTNGQQLAEILPAYESREQLTKQAEAIKQAIQWHQLSGAAAIVSKEITKYEVAIADLINQKKTLESSLVAQQADAVRLQKAADGAADLVGIGAWYQREDDLNRQMTVLQADWNAIDLEVSEINKGIKALKVSSQFVVAGIDPAAPKWEQAHQLLSERLDEQDALVRQLAVQQQLAGMAHTLEDGQPCPLCGALEHPLPLADSDLAQVYEAAKADLNLAKKTLQAFASLQTDWERRQHTLATAVAKYKPVKERIADIQAQKDAHLSGFVWPGYQADDRAAFSIALHQLEKDKQALAQLKLDQTSTETNIAQLQARMEHGQVVLSAKKQEGAGQQAQLNLLRSQIDGLGMQNWENEKIGSLDANVQQLTVKRQDLEASYTKLNTKAQQLALRQKATETSLQANGKQMAEIGTELSRLQVQLTKNLNAQGFSSQSEAEALLGQFINYEHIDADYHAFKDRLAETQGQMLELERQLQGAPYDAEQHSLLRLAVAELKQETDRLMAEVATIQERLTTAKSVLARRAVLESKAQSLGLRQDNIKRLDMLFRGRGFVNYISGIFLRDVVYAANQRFKVLTRNQLSLEIDDKTDFYVRDHLNCGKQRPVRTLSGGQTFQAALCLALALSELIANGENQFFFLDEGFGTQDRDALNDVVATLHDLRDQGKVVGIISHVEELKQLLDVSLVVINDPEKGSNVKIV